MTRKVRLLKLQFEESIEPWEIRPLRSAIAEKAGIQHELFHNHDNANGGFHYRYPLIQYKFSRSKPLLICLNEGVEAMQFFFSRPDWTLELNGRPFPMRISYLGVKEHYLAVLEEPRRYHIRHWVGLKDENYQTYRRLDGLMERVALLEQMLKGHLLSFCDGCGFKPEKRVEAKIHELKDERWIRFKDTKLLGFSLTFSTNLLVPDYIGLGKGSSRLKGIAAV